MRSIGDRICFQVMPWLWPNAEIREGTITDIIDNGGDTYYHVDTIAEGKSIGGMVFEREVVQEQRRRREGLREIVRLSEDAGLYDE